VAEFPQTTDGENRGDLQSLRCDFRHSAHYARGRRSFSPRNSWCRLNSVVEPHPPSLP
jgi:hypothetical protein